MTYEERQALIAKLHELSSSFYNARDNETGDICYAAADELGRLAAELREARNALGVTGSEKTDDGAGND